MLLEKALLYDRVYEELRLREVVIEGLQEFIRLSMKTYCGGLEDATLQNLARYAASLSMLQEGNNSSSARSTNDGDSR